MQSNKDKSKDKPKEKKYYTVELECLVPMTIKYRVLVDEDEYEQAIKETDKQPITSPRIEFNKMRRLSAKVYDYGMSIIRYTKRYY